MAMLDTFIEDELLASELVQPLPSNPSAVQIREIFISIRTDDHAGDGTRENPFSANTPEEFDQVFKDFAKPDVTVRLGPGLFFTHGADFALNTNPLLARSGLRIVGSGIFNTTIRLVAKNPTDNHSRYMNAIGVADGTTVDNFCISDLTIDMNLGGQPMYAAQAYPRMTVHGIGLNGKNNVIRRVRMINFGTRTPFYIQGVYQNQIGYQPAESFTLWNKGEGCVIEDCILEQPYTGCARETTVMTVSGPAGVARNNYFDCAYVNPRNRFETKVTALGYTGSPTATVTVDTQFFHNVKAGDYIEIKGSNLTEFNNRFQVTSPSSWDPLSRELQFTMPTPSGMPDISKMTVEQSFQPTLRISGATWASNVLTINTATRHFRKNVEGVKPSFGSLLSLQKGGVSNGCKTKSKRVQQRRRRRIRRNDHNE